MQKISLKQKMVSEDSISAFKFANDFYFLK